MKRHGVRRRRILSYLLILCMITGALPAAAYAAAQDAISGIVQEDAGQKSIQNPFNDVRSSDWYYDAALYAYQNNIFKGTTDSTFSPENTMTRAMYVTIIGRMAQVDISKYSGPSIFLDVDVEEYYAPYVAWAAELGITTGMDDTHFAPEALINREQMATMTARFFDVAKIPYPTNVAPATAPLDFNSITPFAQEAVMKMWNCGLFQGDKEGNFNPLKNASRGEAATFCKRIDEQMISTGIKSPNKEMPIQPEKKPSKSGSGGSSAKAVSFETNGGGTIANKTFANSLPLSDLPIPRKQDAIFMGWCYDKELENQISTEESVAENTTLYAKYQDSEKIIEKETPSFASATDQSPDFAINIKSSVSMPTEQVMNGITAKNLNRVESTKNSDIINVSGSGNGFTVTGKGGFEEGASYKIVLEDENLSFDGFPVSARQYNFTVKKEEIMDLKLNPELKYIPMNEIRDIVSSGEKVDTLSAPLAVASQEEGMSPNDLTTGQFTYSGTELAIRETVVIYDGIRPDLRTLDNSDVNTDGEIAYVEIVGKNGSLYSYKGADAENVIFTPDILPINIEADKDGNESDNKLELERSEITFSDDKYIKIGLDSETKADEGDFIAFYSGDDFGEDWEDYKSFGKITEIRADDDHNDDVLIIFELITVDEIISSMDAYNTECISGDSMLEGADTSKIERSVEEQARESGFAQEAADALVDLALKTNSFTELSRDVGLSSYDMKYGNGTTVLPNQVQLLASNNKPEVKITKLNATISKNMKHFNNLEGLRLTLDVGIQVTFKVNDDAEIVININGSFEEEVRIDLNVSGKAVWKGMLIDDYSITANIDLYNYTGIDINATIVTKEPSGINEELKDIAKEMKTLLDGSDKYVGDGKNTAADGLTDKYQKMLANESDWVDLFEQNIFTNSFSIALVVAVEISLKFVVSADVNISLGFDFFYENAKRYSYSILVFDKKVVSDVIDVKEERYEFSFYVMGTIGLRAGVRAEIAVGVFSTKIGSIGFTAEAGAYVRLWGYFYYELKYAASTGKSSKYSGALLVEIGIYLEVKFKAQAINGKYTYNPMLYENEWPLWSAGTQDNVMDFAYKKEETPRFSMKREAQTISVPDNSFLMRYMDLKTGDLGERAYDDASNFTISMTNPSFKYDTTTNRLTVDPKGKPEVTGQMNITWKGQPLAFTSAPIARTMNLKWDDLRDSYYISLNSNGGSFIPMILGKYGENIKIPANPLKAGYAFDGWYKDSEFNEAYTIPSTMQNADVVAYAKWKPAADTKYKVEHYLQNLKDSQYTKMEGDTQILQGTTGSDASPEPKNYPGFKTPSKESVEIKWDGSSVLRYYYPREIYMATFDPGSIGGETVYKRIKYQGDLTAPELSADGYTFTGWSPEIPQIMNGGNQTFIAQWNADKDLEYRVEHYIQNTKGDGYTLDRVEYGSEKIGSSVTPTKKSMQDGITYSRSTVNGVQASELEITATGKSVIKLLYDRAQHQLIFKLNRVADENGEHEVACRYEAFIEKPNTPVKSGYKFIGWYTDENMTTPVEFGTLKMPNQNMTIYGMMDYDTEAGFAIIYNGVTELENTENPSRYTVGDEDITLKDPTSREGYTFGGWYKSKDFNENDKVTGVAIPKYSTETKSFYAKWEAIEYPITYYNIEEGENSNPKVFTIESEIILADPIRTGYTFGGWFSSEDLSEANKVNGVAIATGSTEEKVFYAKWTANSYSIAFNANAESYNGSMQTQNFEFDKEQKLTPNSFERKGYEFLGWSENAEGTEKLYTDGQSVKNITGSGTKTLFAKWKPITYTLLGGVNDKDNPTTYTIESPTITLREPKFEGYTFNGWTSGITVSTIPTGSMGDIALTANWSKNKYTLSFQITGNEATGNMSAIEFYYKDSVTLPRSKFERKGYNFLGWATTSSGQLTYGDQQTISGLSGNITLYPVWQSISYNIYFNNSNKYEGVKGWKDSIQVYYDKPFELPAQDAVEAWNLNGAVYATREGASPKLWTNLGYPGGSSFRLTPTWRKGRGTAADPYMMFTAEDINNIPQDSTAYYKMGADIDFQYKPIKSGPFGGVFDGDGHIIKNVKRPVSISSMDEDVFLFRELKNATVKNIVFENIESSPGHAWVGAVASRATGNVTISNVTVDGANLISYMATGAILGDVGESANVSITDCKANNITLHVENNDHVGWLVGNKMEGGKLDMQRNSTNSTGYKACGSI